MNEKERQIDSLNRKLIEIYESDDFIEGDKKAQKNADRLKAQIEELEFEKLSPKQQVRELLERQIAEEEESED